MYVSGYSMLPCCPRHTYMHISCIMHAPSPRACACKLTCILYLYRNGKEEEEEAYMYKLRYR